MTDKTFLSDDEVDVALEWLSGAADLAAQARAERAYMDEYRKSIKAQIMKEHAEKPLGTQEREAYADPRYLAHLDAIREAVFQDEKLRFLKEAKLAVIEAWRTASSNNRAKI